VTSPVPTAESEEVHNLDLHGEDFMVSNANNKIAVSDCPARSYCVLEVDDGFGLLVGSEQGEWGGWVKYVPFYGEPYFVTYGNTSGIFELDGDIYCLWHGNVMIRGYKSGIKKLYLSEETWRSQDDFMELPEVPLAYLVDDGRVYIVTPTKLLLFENEKITVLAEDCFWQRLGPNSLVKIAESLYIGMRGGVAEYDLATGETRWWVRKA
jgi:hypothetical protein